MLHGDRQPARHGLRVGEHLLDRIDGTAGHAALADDRDPVLRRLFLELALDLCLERRLVGVAQIVGAIVRMRREVGPADGGAELRPTPLKKTRNSFPIPWTRNRERL